MAEATNKDTIYIDIDDEITTIIDKVRSSSGRIVALVLPKRASVFQSIVNMKLLKRSAEAAKKHVVLVTTEASLLPLAGAVGLHVAATPQSKPAVPSAGGEPAAGDEVVEAAGEEDEPSAGFTAENAGSRPVGELAGGAPEAIETVDLPDEVKPDGQADAINQTKPAVKNRRLQVPNFNKFRLRLLLAGLVLVLLIVGGYICLAVLPKAAIAITTNSSTVNVNLDLTADTGAKTLDTAKLVVPAQTEQQQKTTTQQVDTTGQKNLGDKAAGTVDLTAQACAPNLGTPNPVPIGSGVTTGGLTFITAQTATFTFDKFDGGSCADYTASGVPITAQSGGSNYNVSGADFTVANRSDVSGTGSAAGGTDKIIHVVAQADIDGAKQKLAAQDANSVKASLEQTLSGAGLYALPQTFKAGKPVITSDANVGDQADTVTVTQAVTYTMYGVKQADLETLIEHSVSGQIDTAHQGILDDGFATATISITGTSSGKVELSLQAVATVGPNISADDIKKQAAGKRSGDVKTLISGIPGVTNVDVRLSPFWVSTVPTNVHKVTVTISGAR